MSCFHTCSTSIMHVVVEICSGFMWIGIDSGHIAMCSGTGHMMSLDVVVLGT